MSAATQTLGRRALNRALLARQHLLERTSERSVTGLVEHLMGLQAQALVPPYLGCWARLERFDPDELGRLLVDRGLVRLTLMRGTVHLVTVRDAFLLRPLTQIAAERGHRGVFGRRMGATRPDEIERAVRDVLADGVPRTARELARELVARGIGDDLEAVGDAVRVHVALVQLPPRGVWGASGQAKYLPLDSWADPVEVEPSIDEVVLRYLAAFGPASVMDAQNWSGLTRLRAVFERLRPQLEVFRDEDGRDLFDVPGAPRPEPDVPAPPRLLGEYDNVLLGHADRRRIIPAGFPWGRLREGGRFVHNLLVDGMVAGAWWVERAERGAAALVVRTAASLDDDARQAVEAEAGWILARIAADADTREIRIDPAVAPGDA